MKVEWVKRLRRALARHMNTMRGSSSMNAQSGMTLIEIIIVVALLGSLMTFLVRSLSKARDETMRDTAGLAMKTLQQSLDRFRIDNNRYPTTEQGLQALIAAPGDAKKWRGPYADEEQLRDPWGNAFSYESDGRVIKMTSGGPDEATADDDVVYPAPKDTGGEGAAGTGGG